MWKSVEYTTKKKSAIQDIMEIIWQLRHEYHNTSAMHSEELMVIIENLRKSAFAEKNL